MMDFLGMQPTSLSTKTFSPTAEERRNNIIMGLKTQFNELTVQNNNVQSL